MDYQTQCEEMQRMVETLLRDRQRLRKKEEVIKIREAIFQSVPVINSENGSLESSLRRVFPPELRPTNVGEITNIAWDFMIPVDFDFGQNPVFTAATRQERVFTVSQEAAFIVNEISVAFGDNSGASFRAPLAVNILDVQSGRLLNDNPIPIQALGRLSNPSVLPTGYLIMPNGRIKLEMSCFLEDGVSMPTIGEGTLQVMLHGLRVRVQDLSRVLSTVFVRE